MSVSSQLLLDENLSEYVVIEGLRGRCLAKTVNANHSAMTPERSTRRLTVLRHPSVYLCGCSWYVMLRPAAGAAMFSHPGAYVQYQEHLLDRLLRHGAQLHAYALLADAVHLLLTPAQGAVWAELLPQLQVPVNGSAVRLPGAPTRADVQGRGDGVHLNSDSAVLSCYRYIDLCPLRAGVVTDPAAWYFSSYGRNALAAADTLVTPHRSYLDLGRSCSARARAYLSECNRTQLPPRQAGSQSLAAAAVNPILLPLAADAWRLSGAMGSRCRH